MKKSFSISSDKNSFGDILSWISVTSKTGILRVVGEKFSVQIQFKKGKIFSISCDDPIRYLGQFLLRKGVIDEKTLKKALEIQESRAEKIKLGEIISFLKGIDEEKISELIREKYVELLLEIFMWDNVRYYFSEGVFDENFGV